ncbi:Ferredoxin--nitrite reductase [hydrothermal vent metagenome]|uniref:Ferredoxin--nitrite reductase n=1 Tax=hydrothermal vent metagenome TaxID=652676 RepID=A0A3B1E4Q0_9ZZZZ
MANAIEVWKQQKHGFDVWEDVLQHAHAKTPMKEIEKTDLERMKWHGFYYRKRDQPSSYMTRVRLTGSELTAKQAKEIAYIAYEFGHGIIDITTRANIQVQGLQIEHLPKVAERFDAVNLTAKQTGHDNIRNVFAHPFSGLLSDELIDTRAFCHAITALFIDSRELSDLPRKFNICLNGTEQHSAHFWTQDLSFLATKVNDEILFRVLIGGTQGQTPRLAWHLPVLVKEEQVVEVTRAILNLFRQQGSREKRNRGRFRFLIEKIGVGGVLEYLEEHLSFRLQPCVTEPMPAVQYDELIGWFRQRDNHLWTMGLSVPLGRMTWQQLEGLALLSKKWGDGSLRTTHEQGIAIANIPSGFKDAAATDAAALGLTIHADPLVRNTMACTGSQFCNIAVTETKGHMLQLIEKLRQRALMLHGIRIHMSGCPSSCAQHFTADIGLKGVRVRRLLGTREGFDIFLGGGIAGRLHMGLLFKLGVDVDQLPQVIEEVVAQYYLKHKPGQTFSAYWRETLQDQEANKVKDDDYQLPTWICEGCNFHHIGEDPPVYCPGCAGLRRLFARVDTTLIEEENVFLKATETALLSGTPPQK